MSTQISIDFFHGLGDCVHAAHILKLYIDRGYEVIVKCTPDKAPIFKAAGCTVTERNARDVHPFLHPPAPVNENHTDHYSGNKVAWNISAPPLPHIGSYDKLWGELCNVRLSLDSQISAYTKDTVREWFAGLPRPVVLFHPQANTSPGNKDVSHDEQRRFIKTLLDRTDGTVVTLDWDNRCYRHPSGRFRHLTDDFKGLSVPELAEAINQADLLVGVDSGPLHLTRFTNKLALGIWRAHHPSHFALPRSLTAHCVPFDQNRTTRFRRLAYNLLECDSIEAVAEQAARMTRRKTILPDATVAEDVLVQHLLDRVGEATDRNRSFDVLFAEATWRGLKRWVGTGCIRSPDDWSAGFSDYLFGLYLKHSDGELDVVDLNEGNCNLAREWTQELPVRLHCANSLDYLRDRKEPVDVFYSDSLDVGEAGCAEHGLAEVQLAEPLLSEKALIAIDDSPWQKGFGGKGRLAIPYLLQRGWTILYHGHQCVLSKGV